MVLDNMYYKHLLAHKGLLLVWQNHLRNEGFVFQDPDQVILDEARMHASTYTKHSKS
jgi:hypothetical protein